MTYQWGWQIRGFGHCRFLDRRWDSSLALMTSHHIAMLLLVLTTGHHVLKDLLIENHSIKMSCLLAVIV